jgi:glycosyltransferase involved in cell wall biosynthesis
MFLVTAEVTVGPLAPELLGASIDLPRSGSTSNAAALTVGGWVVGRTAAVRELRLLSRDSLVRRLRLTEDRPDVAAHLNNAPGSMKSGFMATLDTTDGGPLVVRALLADGVEIGIGQIDLRRSWLSGTHPQERGVVSVVIPCFNHGHFLAAAIESCLQQSYPRVEIVVVDDGSSDNTQEVARRYDGVRYVRQENGGLAAARNTGIRRSNGEYLMFLDADDRLVPEAVRLNVELLERCHECAFVSGEHCYIGVEGRRTNEWARPVVQEQHYAALLRSNYIGCHAAVTYRRSVFQAVGGFDAGLTCCEDYDIYLRIARRFPVRAHGELVAEYRRYGSSMSEDRASMLRGAITVLRRQRQWSAEDPRRRAALAEGFRYWQDYYGPSVASRTRQALITPGRRGRGVVELLQLAVHAPRHLVAVLNGRNRV